MKRRLTMMGAGACALVVLLAGPAFAHECYNASRSDKGNQQIAAHSPSFTTFDESALGFFTAPFGLGLCPAGGQYLLDQIHAAAAEPGSGIDLNWVVSIRSLQAGGLEGTSSQNVWDGKGIDHLGANGELGAVIGANVDAAAALC